MPLPALDGQIPFEIDSANRELLAVLSNQRNVEIEQGRQQILVDL